MHIVSNGLTLVSYCWMRCSVKVRASASYEHWLILLTRMSQFGLSTAPGTFLTSEGKSPWSVRQHFSTAEKPREGGDIVLWFRFDIELPSALLYSVFSTLASYLPHLLHFRHVFIEPQSCITFPLEKAHPIHYTILPHAVLTPRCALVCDIGMDGKHSHSKQPCYNATHSLAIVEFLYWTFFWVICQSCHVTVFYILGCRGPFFPRRRWRTTRTMDQVFLRCLSPSSLQSGSEYQKKCALLYYI